MQLWLEIVRTLGTAAGLGAAVVNLITATARRRDTDNSKDDER
jgi:hypothetical protein